VRDLAEGRILVTGGAGLIGSALIWEMNRRGLRNIFVTDRLGRSEKWKNLVPLQFLDYMEAEEWDRRLADGGRGLPAGIRTVFHLGACSATTETDATYLIRNNYDYTKRMAEWALTQGVRFVYASSAATYGALETNLSESRDLDTLRPLNMYGYSKHRFDCYARAAGILERIVGLKYFNVFGPNEDHKGDMRSVVNKAFHQISRTGSMQLFRSYRPEFADGCQKRDFLYVKDAVKMTLHLALVDDAGGLYNIGSGEARSWLDLAHALFQALGREPCIEFVEMPDTLRAKYQYFTRAEMDRFRATGYGEPLTRLEDAVADYVNNYLMPGRKLGDEPDGAATWA
jgi:ADP-L-glycero-D-manno-heptose 6-epimerase